jgi:hypothetical protein
MIDMDILFLFWYLELMQKSLSKPYSYIQHMRK